MSGVVVGVDGSGGAAQALRWALRYAATDHHPLTVVSVIDPMVLTALWTDRPADSTRAGVLEAARNDAEQLLEQARADSPETKSVDATVRVVCGHPVQALVEAAQDADLLVVGSRGAGGFARLLLGSVSSGVVHHAPCPIVVIPQR